MQQVKRKKYYRITLTVESPLGISSGDNAVTDKDIIKNSAGEPYIPATAISGVVKDILSYGMEKDKYGKTEADDYFGYVLKESDLTEDKKRAIKEDHISLSKNSPLTFYDANLTGDKKYYPSIRDSVSLDEYKTARKGAKFDMEIIEPGVKFVTFVHQDFYGDELDYTIKVADVLMKGVSFGGKTSRGYGKVKAEKAEYVEFDISKINDLDIWLKFDPFKYNKWEKHEEEIKPDNSPENWRLIIGLEQVGGISIRRYTTDPRIDKQSQPDMEQLTAHGLNKSSEVIEEPVIPGTTWAGAFRNRMEEFGAHTGNDSIFGFVKGKEKGKSRINFSESRIHNATGKILSRNAIDRFSGGTVDGALFTEKTWYGGTTELEISWKYVDYQSSEKKGIKENRTDTIVSKEMPEEDQRALAATLTDLHMGFLAIGGETSVGRGLFRITNVDGEDKINDKKISELVQTGAGDPDKEEDIYNFIYDKIHSLAYIEEHK